MPIRDRILKFTFQIFSALCLIAVGVSLICDLVISRGLTWSLYVLISVPFVWLLATPPLILKKQRILSTMAVFTAALPLYLLLMEKLTPIRGWFVPMALPITIASLAAMWATWLLIRYVKINRWYMSAVLVFIYGVIIFAIVQVVVNGYVGQRLLGLSDYIVLLACSVITALLCVIGYGGGIQKKE